jgi:serine/threonine-protein kinase RsbW
MRVRDRLSRSASKYRRSQNDSPKYVAYRGTDAGPMLVVAKHDHGRIIVDIADHGVWQPPPSKPTTRGRGLPIMRAVSAGVDVKSSPEGTTVHISFDAAPQGCGSRTT